MGGRRPSYWQGHRHGRVAMEPYEVDEHVAALGETGLTLYAYCQQRGVERRTLSEGIKEHRPDLFASLVGEGASGSAGPGKGRKLETSAKGILERRGYYVMKSFASKSPLDMLAVGKGRPTLMVQAKVNGKLGTAEWNAVFDLAEEHGCWPVLVSRPPDGAKGAVWQRLTRRREFREPQAGLLEAFDPAKPYEAPVDQPELVPA